MTRNKYLGNQTSEEIMLRECMIQKDQRHTSGAKRRITPVKKCFHCKRNLLRYNRIVDLEVKRLWF